LLFLTAGSIEIDFTALSPPNSNLSDDLVSTMINFFVVTGDEAK
jgi:hypothetical protein